MSSQSLVDLVIWGASGHALVVADIIRLCGIYNIVGYLDNVNPERHGTWFNGKQVLGGREQLPILQSNGIRHLILAFGDCQARLRLAQELTAQGWSFANAIHPRATIGENVSIGTGVVIAAGSVINPGSRIGSQVIINTSASIDHSCVIEDGAHIAPGAHLAGDVYVGKGAWIGIGAIVKEKIHIGAGALIGAGTLVLADVPARVEVYGSPARVIRSLEVDTTKMV